MLNTFQRLFLAKLAMASGIYVSVTDNTTC